ncbi:hypothetical protein [Nostoc sp. JL33]|uniref:hypothetical protein n=1 Tax=Nostoc sp. JL33 TaxID=2815396 RepID=UPI0034477D7F
MDKVGNFIIPPQFGYSAYFSEVLALISIGMKLLILIQKVSVFVRQSYKFSLMTDCG